MFHIVFSVASRFLFFGDMLQRLARGILSLTSLGAISSHLIPTLSPPPPILLLDAAAPFVELPQETISPYPSAGPIAVGHIERRTPVFSSPIPSYQSSLVSVTPSLFPNFLPLFITLVIISGFVILLPGIVYFFLNVARILSNVVITVFQWCGLLPVQDTQTCLFLKSIYEQVKLASAYDDFVWCSDLPHTHDEEQLISDCALCSPLLDDRGRDQLISALRESDKKQRAWEVIAVNARACRAEADSTVTKLRADLTAALDRVRDVREQLDRQTLLLSSKDRIIQSITEESQVARVRLKNAENKIERLNVKLQCVRDLRRRLTQRLLDKQAKERDHHESEMRRVTQEAQDAQDIIRGQRAALDLLQEKLAATMERLRLSSPPTKADGKLRRDRRPRYYPGSPPRNRIPRLDYGLPEDFVPTFGRLAPAIEFNDFGYLIPLDCPTSTPVASKKRPVMGSPGSGSSPAALTVVSDLSPSVGRGLLPSPNILF